MLGPSASTEACSFEILGATDAFKRMMRDFGSFMVPWHAGFFLLHGGWLLSLSSKKCAQIAWPFEFQMMFLKNSCALLLLACFARIRKGVLKLPRLAGRCIAFRWNTTDSERDNSICKPDTAAYSHAPTK